MSERNTVLTVIIAVVLIVNIFMMGAVLKGLNIAQQRVNEGRAYSISNHTLLCANYQLRLKQDALVQNSPEFRDTFEKEC